MQSNITDTTLSAVEDVTEWHRRICPVTERLLLSGDLHEAPEQAVAQLEDWKRHGVTHILDCRVEHSDERLVRRYAPSISYRHLGVDDDGGEQQTTWFDEGVAWIASVLAEPKSKVLVHCHMGVNRAPSMVFAALLSDGWDPVVALKQIATVRPIAAVLYATDALSWHHEHCGTAVPAHDRAHQIDWVAKWVDSRLVDAAQVIGRLRSPTMADHQWRRIERDDVIREVAEAFSMSVASVTEVVDALDDRIIEALDEGKAVDFPGLGPLDGRDDERESACGPPATVTFLDLASEVADQRGIAAPSARSVVGEVIKVIEAAAEAGDVVHIPVMGLFGPDFAMEIIDAEDRLEAVQRLRDSRRQVWLVQANPAKFDLFAAIEQGGPPENWSVNRYLDRIKPGDRIVFWVSGAKGGVYGIGEVTSEPYDGRVNDEFAIDPNANWTTYVDFELYLDLFNDPILRSDLKSDVRFAGQTIIRIPAAANPHQIDNDAFDAILERLSTG